ncbi:MAG: SUMF1/EgtB/PvdO family nonheme iron enzyme [Candidatus Alcyoniella australis]|nr:SUMF1/EgtB/PvdO family nonheme iron enzyme [Candidatus Alcyoniella australis]
MSRPYLALLILVLTLLLPASDAMLAAGPCPPEMVYISGGTAWIGSDDPQRTWARPRRQVQLEPYCIDRYEYPNVRGRQPMILVSWTQADGICRSLGKRLCLEDEWMRACSGPEGWLYPYGDEQEPGRCATELEFGTRNFPPAGSHPDCRTAEGVYDMDGSVSEWVADLYEGVPHDAWERRVVRGSTGWSSDWYGQDCTSRHFHEKWNDTFGDDGFRCCRDVAAESAP